MYFIWYVVMYVLHLVHDNNEAIIKRLRTMATINKDEIARLVNQINNGTNTVVPSIIRKIDEAVCWAWENWDEGIISTYYKFEKPERPNEGFINNWVENEDFEADGFDMEELAEL